jgi:S-adenosylmethionine:tRNA ribosyltransferase-isomerase
VSVAERLPDERTARSTGRPAAAPGIGAVERTVGQPVPALPEGAVATSPPEARGLPRDGVRMLVASASEGLSHRRAYHLPAALRPGDLLVINTSDTLPAALRGVTIDGELVEVHLSTVDPAADTPPAAALRSESSPWVVELREPSTRLGGEPSAADRAGAAVALAGGARLTVHRPYPDRTTRRRLWTAELTTPAPLGRWLTLNGEPVRYGYTAARWPLSAYRTGHADTPGSAEMPSAGRPLTARTFRRLRLRGVRTAALVLHCGLSSPDADEAPYAEWYSVPQSTLDAVRETREQGGRLVAVGTTVVRALESAVRSGRTEGWTDLVVTPENRPSTVDGLLTGWHPPEASHLRLLAAVTDQSLLAESYRAALGAGYRWHEFGDVHLILP